MKLLAKNICVQHPKGRKILDHIDLEVHAGEVVALLGANGAGKSTLSACLAGDVIHLPMLSGEVLLNDLVVQQASAKQLARHRAVLTQYPSLQFSLNVREILEMGAYPFPELDKTKLESSIHQALEWANIQDFAHRNYQELSGGEKQRVQFARILVQLFAQYNPKESPRYCLLDEPTSSLDPKHQQDLLKALKRLAQEFHFGILIVLHDVNLAALHCDKLVLLANGAIIAQGSPQSVLTPDHLEAIYGIRGQTIAHPFVENKVLVVWS